MHTGPPFFVAMKAGGEEIWGFVPEEEDDGLDRTCFFFLTCCPRDDCSQQSWHKARIYSYQGKAKAIDYLTAHLTKSSKHSLEFDEALEIATNADWTERVETFADRERFRTEMKASEERAAKKSEERDAKKSGRGKKKTGLGVRVGAGKAIHGLKAAMHGLSGLRRRARILHRRQMSRFSRSSSSSLQRFSRRQRQRPQRQQ